MAKAGRWLRTKVHVIRGQKIDGKEVDPFWSTEDGWRYSLVKGLAVTPESPYSDYTDWVVTHQQSGRCIPGFEGELEDAKKVLQAVAPLADWTLDRDALLAIPALGIAVRYAWGEVLKIEGSTTPSLLPHGTKENA